MSIFNFEKNQLVIFPDPHRPYMPLMQFYNDESFEVSNFVAFIFKTGVMTTEKVQLAVYDETYNAELAVSNIVTMKSLDKSAQSFFGKVRFDIEFNMIEATIYNLVAKFSGYNLHDYTIGFALDYPKSAYTDPVTRKEATAFVEVYKKEPYKTWL